MKDFKTVVTECWDKEVAYNKKDVKHLLSKREELAKFGIIYRMEEDKVIFGRYDKFKSSMKKYLGHKYEMPYFADEVLSLLRCANEHSAKSCNIMLSGAAGTGKSEFVHEITKIAGFSKCIQVNGREDMDTTDFLGDKTVVVDPVSKQNYIKFNKGPLYKAFIEGTELDENGDQILYNDKGERVYDWTGNPKVIGKPACFFLDEFAAILPSVFLAVFNRAMEIPRNGGESRGIEITTDGGKVVKSHPGFVMFLAGNTVGKGTENESQMGYTAQNNLMDDSTLNRISATYIFGYNLKAEEKIMTEKLQDDMNVDKLISFRNEIRKLWSDGKVETLLSTRSIVNICDQAMLFQDFDKKNYIPLAIYRNVFSGLREREKAGWNELIRSIWGINVVNAFERKDNSIWYPQK